MKARTNLRTVGIVLMTLSLLLVLAYSLLYHSLFAFLEQHFSMDHCISPLARRAVSLAYYLATIFMAVLGGLLLSHRAPALLSAGKRALLTDPICHSHLPRISFVCSSLLGVSLAAMHVLNYYILQTREPHLHSLYREDGVFETLTAIALLAASALMVKGMIVLATKRRGKPEYTRVLGVWVVVALAFFVVGMEEISWGQRIVGWETPDGVFADNLQQETNLHNFLSSEYFPVLHWLFALVTFIAVLTGAWLEVSGRGSSFSRLVFPHPSLIGLGFMMLLCGWMGELLEELFGLFALCYSLRVGIGLNRWRLQS